jgi:uncharacterized protein (DUF433 family)
VADGDVAHDQVSEYYPSVSAADVADAIAFADLVKKYA